MSINWKKIGIVAAVIIVVSLFISNLYVVYAANQRNDGYVTVGIPASPGINGAQGPAGTAGQNGASGSNGSNGANGSNGENGTNGSSGVSGTNGTNGTDGANGADAPAPQMKCDNGLISWKTANEDSWHPLGRVLYCETSSTTSTVGD